VDGSSATREVDGVEAARSDVDEFMFDLVDALADHWAWVSAGHGRVEAIMTVTGPTVVDAARVAVEAMTGALGGNGQVVRLSVLPDAEAYGDGA
jgi:hypothetical protein